jgi:AcrR family transcriptional regulator
MVNQTDQLQVKKGERTRSSIMAAAHRLFLSKGYSATSMRAIADESGLALGGIYNHFANKEEIFEAILIARHPFQDMVPALQAAQGKTVEELVQDAARQMLTGLGQRRDVLHIMFIEWVEFEGKHVPQLRDEFYERVMEFGQRMAAYKGKLRPIPVPILIRVFVGLLFSYYMTETFMNKTNQAKYRREAFDDFVDIYLHGILAK